MANKPDERFYRLLEQLQQLDFVLVELNLYLDTHPDDMQAIQQFNQVVQQRWAVAQEYEKLYGPLLHFGRSYSRHPWEWIETPWPWQV